MNKCFYKLNTTAVSVSKNIKSDDKLDTNTAGDQSTTRKKNTL